ncbi:MAG: CPBP family intramembrane metalloprotease, partial [Clostridia bacterium]|nr:CPBP family intramembrane metalloprotease [Clostridia bacterium]
MEQKAQITEAELKKRALAEAGVTYSLCAALPVLCSLVLSLIVAGLSTGKAENWYQRTDWYRYLCYLIPQLCFAVSVFVWFRRTRTPLKRVYGGCKWYFFPIAIVLQFGLTFSLAELNSYFVAFLELFGYRKQTSMLPSLGGWNLLPAMLVIAVLPALFEETVFRGILSKQMDENGWGIAATVLISGALFSLFHHNPEQTVYQFFCGACFTLVALRSGSVFPTMVAHFLNNGVILALSSLYTPK